MEKVMFVSTNVILLNVVLLQWSCREAGYASETKQQSSGPGFKTKYSIWSQASKASLL